MENLQMTKKLSLGIDIGSTTVKTVITDSDSAVKTLKLFFLPVASNSV